MKTSLQKDTGFTIIELLVALTIAAIMMVYALPAFNDFTEQRRKTADVNLMVSAIGYARSEATRFGGDVSLQALNPQAADEWGAGFCVTVGDPGNCDAPLRVFDLEGGTTFNAVDGLNNEPTLTFNSRGLLQDGLSGTLRLCGADASDDPGRAININALGRPNVVRLVCYP